MDRNAEKPVPIGDRWASDDAPVTVVTPPTENAEYPDSVIEEAKPSRNRK